MISLLPQEDPVNIYVFAEDADLNAQSKNLDEALEESFPASDPVAISITAIDPGMRPP